VLPTGPTPLGVVKSKHVIIIYLEMEAVQAILSNEKDFDKNF
jgi:hypothetical protein